ncbi:hypothetical protein FB566_3606 [Stackebrandtia endophytica]|uniref:Uncharacterized protein n=2 Tax=Stackebrandtia endophytica TaxID=1496996 RepID=A0A543AZN6_9ACTN|nr:hypothetical protein FB566_3606 [Stackebrandtia endophytica]
MRRKRLYDPGAFVVWVVAPFVGYRGKERRRIAFEYPKDDEAMAAALSIRVLIWLIAAFCSVVPSAISNVLRNAACISTDALVITILNYSSAGLVGFSSVVAVTTVVRWGLAHPISWLGAATRLSDKVFRPLRWWFCAPSVLEFAYGALFAMGMVEAMLGPTAELSGC